MRLVERMTLTPATCISCGKGNTADSDGEIGPFLDIERDVDWGDSVYFCMTCVMKLAATCNFASPDEVADFQRQIRDLEKRLHDTESEMEQRGRRAVTAEKKLHVIATADKIKRGEKRRAEVA